MEMGIGEKGKFWHHFLMVVTVYYFPRRKEVSARIPVHRDMAFSPQWRRFYRNVLVHSRKDNRM